MAKERMALTLHVLSTILHAGKGEAKDGKWRTQRGEVNSTPPMC